ncbi:MAG TPA: PQQ-binding-like beta-propeller repeat protein [Casimicrobiaceae bacterium]|jgi:outer membrane protein assembly factor BamB|nr:PQQ-binding-like beta-propeller repeat protein [Casimicrobiaceae bacterium]
MVIALGCVAFAATPAVAYDWLQFNGDQPRAGNNTSETIIGAANVGSLTQLFQVGLPNVADGAPVLLQGVTTLAGVQDLLFVNTTDGWILALNAQTGATVWSKQLTGSNFMTTSPAIDPNRLYVYSYGLDGYAHKFQVGNGTEITTGGWPVKTTTKVGVEKASAPLATATVSGTSYLYVVHGGYPGDAGDYQGHLSAINLGTAAANVFNAMCSTQTALIISGGCVGNGSAIWGRPSAVYDAGTGKIYVATGNATNGFGGAGTWNGTTMWSESLLALNPNGTGASGKPLDSYTPSDVDSLDQGDTDIGSTAVAILPVPATSNVPHLGVLGGKDSILRLLDLDNLSDSGTPGPGHQGGEIFTIGIPQGDELLSQPAIWVNPADASTWVFIGNTSGLSGLQLAIDGSGNPSLVKKWQLGSQSAASSPLVANNVLYFFGSGALTAYAPTTGTQLWSVAVGGGVHWQSPVVANGVLYVEDGGGNLNAFAPPPAVTPAITSANSATFQLGVAGTFTVTATGSPAPTLSESGALPNGVTFTPATGVLAGKPTVSGSFPLQFTASNGNPPNAVQSFTLKVNGVANPASLTYSDPNCAGFALSGSPPNQLLICSGGAAHPSTLVYSDPSCSSFTLSGSAPNQVLNCAP